MIIDFHLPGLLQLPNDMVDPAMRLMDIGLVGFHHGIDQGTGIVAGGCIAKEPGAPTSDKGADRFLLSRKPLKVLVPRAGVEPAQPLGREILSLFLQIIHDNLRQNTKYKSMACVKLNLPIVVDKCRFSFPSVPPVSQINRKILCAAHCFVKTG